MPDLSRKELQNAARTVWNYKMGQLVSLLIHVGDRLGLYKHMWNAGFVTAKELAEMSGFDERWILEWLRGMTAAKILQYREGVEVSEDAFCLSSEMAEVLANETESTYFAAGAFGGLQSPMSDAICESFKSGRGTSYDMASKNSDGACCHETKRSLGPWTKLVLVPKMIPQLSNGSVLEKLRKGAKVLDVGCGAGIAVNTIAAAFPQSSITGIDPDVTAIAVAREDAHAAGLTNVNFEVAKGEDISGSYDFVMCLDVLHDCPFPDRILATIRSVLKDDGLFLIKDIRCTGSFAQDLKNVPNLAMLYGFSISMCMSSALSEEGGMGLGTVGFGPPVVERMCHAAGFGFEQNVLQSNLGFASVTPRDFGDPANLYYEVYNAAAARL
eukprot:gnl/MRDRNA2_/MRDRNA2_83599_c0_seq2.p1 gnl/MRDRNA2_/MRDRNA2_83599_c0~~gnl/MRDRNA2_/MRDRNA2_83599_c0_seq2.p1  ORF type:complete len:384 (-),score=92.10 gnl/MRDRNA2_/MRDRNA2_83599_c0_seq2:140-1291(-)